MDEFRETDLNDRQRFAKEYMQYSPDLPSKIEREKEDKIWRIMLQGKSRTPPEIGPLGLGVDNEPNSPLLIYYDLDTFKIIHLESDMHLDLIKLTPQGWKQKSINLTNPRYAAPEFHHNINHSSNIDPRRREIVMGDFTKAKEYDLETVVKISLWNLLVARFLEDVGNPANEISKQAMSKVILERRKQVLNALKGKVDKNPTELMKQPFS